MLMIKPKLPVELYYQCIRELFLVLLEECITLIQHKWKVFLNY